MKCGSVKQDMRLQAVGDMRHLIYLRNRSIEMGADNGVNFDEIFTANTAIWAKVKSVRGKMIFSGTNVQHEITHEMYIWYVAALERDITSDIYVEYDGEYYDILDVEDLDERHIFMKLSCALRGETDLAVNKT
jgi:SPP1 family predicted phage head-tail adaptor